MSPHWKNAFQRLPTFEMLNSFLDYSPASGTLIWKRGKNAGKIAGFKQLRLNGKPNSVRVCVLGRLYAAHHVVWKLHGLDIPSGSVMDHADGDPFNNRIENLRVCNMAQNCSNKVIDISAKIEGTPKGVAIASRNKHKKTYIARVQFDGKRRYVGSFTTITQAKAARDAAAQVHHGVFARS